MSWRLIRRCECSGWTEIIILQSEKIHVKKFSFGLSVSNTYNMYVFTINLSSPNLHR